MDIPIWLVGIVLFVVGLKVLKWSFKTLLKIALIFVVVVLLL